MQRSVHGRCVVGLEADAKGALVHALHLGLFVRIGINPKLCERLELFRLSLQDRAAVDGP